MALSDKRILEEKKKGNIVITPFKEEHLNTSSYDVTLGEYYFREQKSPHYMGIYNIYNKRHTEVVWGTKPEKAEKAKVTLKDPRRFKLDPNLKIILIEPGETILAHTNEFIGGKNHITTMMKARSSMGRNFIEVCKCAGWGDVGYTNRWTMEITNNSRKYTIPLIVGGRMAQIVFFETGEILDKDYAKTGKYQTKKSLEDLKKDWKPEMMLPRLYKDFENK
jgi:dCTP deaminase